MKKLLVFTKKASLNVAFDDVADDRDDLKDWKGMETPVLFYEEEHEKFMVARDLTQPGLYFVYDLINQANFQLLVKEDDPSNLYILKHSKPSFPIPGTSIKGTTEKRERGGEFYPDLVEILGDDQPEKVRRIFAALFPPDTEETRIEAIFDALYRKEDKKDK